MSQSSSKHVRDFSVFLPPVVAEEFNNTQKTPVVKIAHYQVITASLAFSLPISFVFRRRHPKHRDKGIQHDYTAYNLALAINT